LELLVAGESDDEKGVEKQGEKLKPGKYYGTDLGKSYRKNSSKLNVQKLMNE
jgi:hypothetical protein